MRACSFADIASFTVTTALPPRAVCCRVFQWPHSGWGDVQADSVIVTPRLEVVESGGDAVLLGYGA